MENFPRSSKLKFLVFIFLFYNFVLYGQENSQSVEALVLTNTKTNKTANIKSAKKVKVWCNDDLVIKGRLQDVFNDSIMVDNQMIGLNQINKIRISVLGAKIVGGTFLTGGAILISAGTGIALGANSATGCAGPALATAIGVFTIGVGAGVALISIPILFIGKKFDCEKNWKLSTALIVE